MTGDGNTAVIDNNSITHAGKVAPFLLNSPSGAAMRLGPGKGNAVTLGSNRSNATMSLVNSGNVPVSQK
jgi:hypothetical protein